MTKVVIVGQGYVGLPLAVRAAEVGFEVLGFDIDETKVDRLLAGLSPVEDISGQRLGTVLSTGGYRASTDEEDLKGFDIAVISVPTPLREHRPDLSYIEQAARTLGPLIQPGCCVILESTTWPGTTEELVQPILEAACGLRAGEDFHLGYSPERIDPGNPIWTLETTPKVVSGVSRASLQAVQSFFDRIVNTTVPVPSPKEAELAKLLENTFRHVNIALINEMAMFAGDLGIDIWATIEAAASKPFGFMKFTPGPGVGGHCLPIDPSYLSWRVKESLGHSFRFVELANDINDHMPEYVVQRVSALLNDQARSVRNSRILILGLAYKKDTGDAREAPARHIAERLTAMGAQVAACDPLISPIYLPDSVILKPFDADALAWADLTVLAVDHTAFDVNAIVQGSATILDCRHVVPSANHVSYL